MPLHVCIECGARVPDLEGPCPMCDARPPSWRAVPVGAGEVVRRLFVGAALLALFVASTSAYQLARERWLQPAEPMVRLAVLTLLLIFAVGSGYLSIRETFLREYRHDEEGRRGRATALFGILLQGEGQALRVEAPFEPRTASLDGVGVFASMRIVHPVLARVLRSPTQPKAVDIAVLAAFLGLAARGQIDLVAGTPRRWRKPLDGWFVERSTTFPVAVKVRRRAAAGLAPEEGWLERALLAVIDGEPRAAPPERPAPLTGPYRRGRDEAPVEAAGGKVVTVEEVLRALTGGLRQPRLHLHRLLRAEAAGGTIGQGDAEGWGKELVSAVQGRRWGAGRALLAHIQEALADREDAPRPPERG